MLSTARPKKALTSPPAHQRYGTAALVTGQELAGGLTEERDDQTSASRYSTNHGS